MDQYSWPDRTRDSWIYISGRHPADRAERVADGISKFALCSRNSPGRLGPGVVSHQQGLTQAHMVRIRNTHAASDGLDNKHRPHRHHEVLSKEPSGKSK